MEDKFTVQNLFHKLGNWHNKISIIAGVTKELLLEENARALQDPEWKERFLKGINNLNQIEQDALSADKTVSQLKEIVYKIFEPGAEVTLALDAIGKPRWKEGEGEDMAKIEIKKKIGGDIKDIGKGIKILIVDDEKDICKFSKELFIKRGFETYTVLTGKAGINVVKKVKPHIAFLDIYLEGKINGLELLKFIKKNQPNCFCVMVSREDDKKITREAIRIGAFDYLTKPSTIKEIDKVLEKILSKIKKES